MCDDYRTGPSWERGWVMKLGTSVLIEGEVCAMRRKRGRRRVRAEDRMTGRLRTLVMCGLEGTRRLRYVETAILRL